MCAGRRWNRFPARMSAGRSISCMRAPSTGEPTGFSTLSMISPARCSRSHRNSRSEAPMSFAFLKTSRSDAGFPPRCASIMARSSVVSATCVGPPTRRSDFTSSSLESRRRTARSNRLMAASATSCSTRTSSDRSTKVRSAARLWLVDYNTVRPHWSLGYLTPAEFVATLTLHVPSQF